MGTRKIRSSTWILDKTTDPCKESTGKVQTDGRWRKSEGLSLTEIDHIHSFAIYLKMNCCF